MTDVDSGSGPQADPEAVARAIVLRRLTSSPRTRAELRADLDRRLVPGEVSDRVLDRFHEVGLVDDRSLAQSFATSGTVNRGWSRREVARRLRERGIAEDDIEQAVEPITDENERDRALSLVRRKWARLEAVDRDVRRRRLAGMLARKGYSPGLALSVVRTVERDVVSGVAD